MLLGSLAYMSPEQRIAEALTGATDQYALAVSVFEMLAGRGPFIGAPVDVHMGHLNSPPPSVREFRPDVPEAVAHALDRMLAKSPADRFPDLREPRQIFERLVTDARSVSAEIAKLSGVLAAPTASRVMSAVRKAPTMSLTNPASVAMPTAGAPPVAPPPAAPAAMAPEASALPSAAPSQAPSRGRGVIVGAVVIGLCILAGAVALKSRWATSPASQPAQQSSREVGATVSSLPSASGNSAARPASAPAPAASPATPVGRPREGNGSSVQAPSSAAVAPQGVPLPTAQLVRPPDAAAASESAAPSTVPRTSAAAVPSEPVAGLADARAAARALVTLMNQHRARDLERLADAGGGDAAARRTLERLVREATDFAAGFAAMASEPEPDGTAFRTEFVLDASWRSGGRDVSAVFDIRLLITRQGDTWVPSGYSVQARQ
jgi:serine/threonine-protein kinase